MSIKVEHTWKGNYRDLGADIPTDSYPRWRNQETYPHSKYIHAKI